jgi:hypothetical protein
VLGTVHLEASWLGDPSLFPQEEFTTLLWNITNASLVSIEPMSVDMLLGKNARVIFPNSSIYSFSIVYVTHIRFEIETFSDYAAIGNLNSHLASLALYSGMGFLVIDYVNVSPRAVGSSEFHWPDYMTTVAVGGWSTTAFICVLLVIALLVKTYYPAVPAPMVVEANPKSARAPTLRVPQYVAPTAGTQRELLLKIPTTYTRR